MRDENLASFVRFWARTRPHAVAVVDGDVETTWGELNDRTSGLSNGLRACGVSKGDRIGLLAPNCLEYLEVVIAAYKLGAVTVPLNHRLTAPELEYVIENSGSSVVISHSDTFGVADEAMARLGDQSIRRVGITPGFGTALDELRSRSLVDPNVEVGRKDLAYICYTSGTTGRPKGAMLTHGNVLVTTQYRNLADDLGQSARLYLPAPLAFAGTLVMLWGTAYVGGGMTVLDRTVDARRSLEAIERHRITDFVAVPVIWEAMLRDPDFASYDLSSLRTCLTGGATVTEKLLRSLWDAGLPVRNAYGLTEGASSSTWQSVAESQREPMSVGRSTIHNSIRVVDPKTNDLADVPAGEIGEVAISGPEVMVGYWNDSEATANALVDGWLLTGDLGRLTDDGYLHIVGRIKDMFISGGLNVYPAEIESVLEEITEIEECAVIGVPDPRWGETAAAIVRTVSGSTLNPEQVRERCASFLADYKLPRYVVIRDSPLPRNMAGKVLKHDLVEEYVEDASLGEPLR